MPGFLGESFQWMPELDCGVMGPYDLFYVIDVAYFDQEFVRLIPGLNLLTNADLRELMDSGKVKFQESYGGDYDAFVTKLAADGSLAYSTYLGGDVNPTHMIEKTTFVSPKITKRPIETCPP